jgi:hypothetical protein
VQAIVRERYEGKRYELVLDREVADAVHLWASTYPPPTQRGRRAQGALSLLGLAGPSVVVQLAGIHARPDGVFAHHHTRVRDDPDLSVAIGPAG